jgi:hypothetical protein
VPEQNRLSKSDVNKIVYPAKGNVKRGAVVVLTADGVQHAIYNTSGIPGIEFFRGAA